MTLETVIKLDRIAKSYRLYKSKKDRLKEALHPAGKKYHHDFHALRNISLEVKRGEILGIMGKNGAGKSTLLQIISDVLTPTSGTRWTQGTVIPLLDLGAGFNPEFTGLQNIYFKAALQGLKKKEIDKRLEAILAFADIGDFVYQPVRVYSSGMKARLGFAVSVNIDPEILVVDEVLAVGDEFFKRKCYLKMQQLMQSGCTVIYVSHSRNTIVQLCTRAILLDSGELLMDGTPLVVTRQYEKLLYAAPENYPAVRQEIVERNGGQDQPRTLSEGNKPGAAGIPDNIPDDEEGFRPEPFFLEDFTTRTTVRQKLLDVDIFDAQLKTLSNDDVNALIMDEPYIFLYKVRFNLDLENVTFSMLVQNEKGLSISGFTLPAKDSTATINAKAGETYLVRNTFTCLMLPGSYYISVSVAAVNEALGKNPASRVSDILVFKVIAEKNLSCWGMVNIEQAGEIKKLEP